MPPYIVTSKTQDRYLGPPQGPFTCNLGSEFAQGLVAWWPLLQGAVSPGGRAWDHNPGTTKQHLSLTGSLGWGGTPFGPTAFANTGAANYWTFGTAVLTALPVSMSCWFAPASVSTDSNLMFIAPGNFVGIIYDGANGYGRGAGAVIADAADTAWASSATTVTKANTWHQATGTFASTTSRTAYLDGGNKGTNATSVAFSSVTETLVGAYRAGSPFSPLNGAMFDACIWNVVLTDAQAARRYDPQWRWDLYYTPRRVAYSFSSGGGTTFTRSLTDNLAGSDTFARVADGKRSLTQNSGVSDSTLRVASGVRVFNDNLALSDSFLRKADANRSMNDTAALSDSLARLANANRQATDNTAAADSYARVADAKRALSDSLALAEAFARLSNANRAYADNLALADAFARVSDAKRALSDGLGLADSFARIATALRAVTDTLALADAYARVATALRAFSDTVGTSDAYARQSTAKRNFTDTLALADAATLTLLGAGVLMIAVSDLLALSDSYARRADAGRQVADLLGLADSVARLSDAKRAISDPLALSDAYARQATYARLVTDSVAVAELASLLGASGQLPPYLPALGSVARDPGRGSVAVDRGRSSVARDPGRSSVPPG